MDQLFLGANPAKTLPDSYHKRNIIIEFELLGTNIRGNYRGVHWKCSKLCLPSTPGRFQLSMVSTSVHSL